MRVITGTVTITGKYKKRNKRFNPRSNLCHKSTDLPSGTV